MLGIQAASFVSGLTLGRFYNHVELPPRSWLERVVIIGLGSDPSSGGSATLRTPTAEAKKLQTKFDAKRKELVIRKPGVNMADEWEIDLLA